MLKERSTDRSNILPIWSKPEKYECVVQWRAISGWMGAQRWELSEYIQF
jgi:hypothetical protein